MSRTIVLSGLDESSCRRLLGDARWAAIASAWRDPAGVIERGGADLVDATLCWLYRSPSRELLESPATQPTATLLDEWAARNHAALNLRRVLQSRLMLLDADALGADALVSLLRAPAGVALSELADRLAAQPQDDAQATLASVLDGLLERMSPRAHEVRSLLDAASWPRRNDPSDGANDQDRVVLLVDALRKGLDDGGLLPHLEDAERRCSELERDLATERVAYRSYQAEHERCRAERDQLQVQLHQVQEELEQYYIAGLKQAGKIAAQNDHLSRADEESRALKLQVQCMQEELLAALVQRTQSPAQPTLWRRAKFRFRRSVLGRIRPAWRPAGDGLQRTADLALLSSSRWFNKRWYLERYQDVAAAGLDPVEHYLDFGAQEGRDPGPDFSTEHYLQTNADVSASGANPLLHFIRHGITEGRLPRKP